MKHFSVISLMMGPWCELTGTQQPTITGDGRERGPLVARPFKQYTLAQGPIQYPAELGMNLREV